MRATLVQAIRSVVCIVVLMAGAGELAAQGAADFPEKPIRIVVGFGPGGGNDILARLIAQKMSENWGQPVVVENKPGAGSMLAMDYVKGQPADGYTLLMAANGAMSANPALYTSLNYSPLSDYAHIALIASFPLVLIANAETGVKTVADVVAYSRANPTKANWAGPSPVFQLAVEQFKLKTGVPGQFVPYKSSAEVVTAVMQGATPFSLIDIGPVAGQVRGGSVRGIAVTSARRSTEFPEIPTLTESGLPSMDMTFWSCLLAPAGTPPAIVKKLADEAMRIIGLPDIQDKIRHGGVNPDPRGPEDLRRFVEAEIARWSAVAKAAGLKIEK